MGPRWPITTQPPEEPTAKELEELMAREDPRLTFGSKGNTGNISTKLGRFMRDITHPNIIYEICFLYKNSVPVVRIFKIIYLDVVTGRIWYKHFIIINFTYTVHELIIKQLSSSTINYVSIHSSSSINRHLHNFLSIFFWSTPSCSSLGCIVV